jgi:hypothetical protein
MYLICHTSTSEERQTFSLRCYHFIVDLIWVIWCCSSCLFYFSLPSIFSLDRTMYWSFTCLKNKILPLSYLQCHPYFLPFIIGLIDWKCQCQCLYFHFIPQCIKSGPYLYNYIEGALTILTNEFLINKSNPWVLFSSYLVLLQYLALLNTLLKKIFSFSSEKPTWCFCFCSLLKTDISTKHALIFGYDCTVNPPYSDNLNCCKYLN